MKIYLKVKFLKSYKKRFSHLLSIRKKIDERIELFQMNPQNPVLGDHELKGSKVGFRAFSCTGDVRIVYFIQDDVAYFMDIGTHNQVY